MYNGIRVLRCFRCKEFNHKAANCKNDEVCVKCHSQHRNSECNEGQLNKCINCIRANGELNLGLNVIKCIYVNISNIVANKEELERIIELQEASIVLCSETCTTSNIEDAEISIATFNMIRCDSHSRHTGGVLIYIKKSITYNLICNKTID